MSVLRADPAAPERRRSDRRLTVDRLANRHDPVEVVLFDSLEVGCDGDSVREPHRHDYHELIWTRDGAGRHMLDDRSVPVVPGTITVIGRGQVHVFERAQGLVGAAVRFGDELLHERPIARADPAWLFAGCGGWNVTVPESQHAALEATIATLAAESAGPLDARSADLQRHLLSVLLLWIERWYDGQHTERRDARRRRAGDSSAASRACSNATSPPTTTPRTTPTRSRCRRRPCRTRSAVVAGKSTKELVTDRVMLEAARLLRFTDRTHRRDRLPDGLRRPAVLLARVQAPPRASRRPPSATARAASRRTERTRAAGRDARIGRYAPDLCMSAATARRCPCIRDLALWIRHEAGPTLCPCPRSRPPRRRSCPRRCGSAPPTSPSRTSTARSPSTSARSACSCTAATATAPAWAPAARTCSCSSSEPGRRARRAPRRPLPLRAAARLARGARARGRAPRRDAHPHRGRLGPRRLRGDLPARPRRQRHRAVRRPPARRSGPPPAQPGERVGIYTIALDIPALLKTVEGEPSRALAGPGLRTGHLHLHVGERRPRPGVLPRRARLRGHGEPRLRRVPLGRRLPPPPRLQRLARPRRQAQAARHGGPAPLDRRARERRRGRCGARPRAGRRAARRGARAAASSCATRGRSRSCSRRWPRPSQAAAAARKPPPFMSSPPPRRPSTRAVCRATTISSPAGDDEHGDRRAGVPDRAAVVGVGDRVDLHPELAEPRAHRRRAAGRSPRPRRR